jgi:hypothetical protein
MGLAELVLTAGWYIWWERRQKVHGESIQFPNRSALSIIVLARNYMLAKKKPHAKPEEGWCKPLERKLMINVDAAFDVDSGKGATGVVTYYMLLMPLWLRRMLSGKAWCWHNELDVIISHAKLIVCRWSIL